MTTATLAPVHCPLCKRNYHWKPHIAGMRVKCKCGNRLNIPAQPTSRVADAATQQAEVSRAEQPSSFTSLLASLDGPVQVPTGTAPADAPPSGGGLRKYQPAKPKRQKRAKTAKPRRNRVGASSSASPLASPVQVKVAGVGLTLHFAGYVCLALAMVACLIPMLTAGQQISPAQADEMAGGLVMLLIVVGLAALPVGIVLALAAPWEAGRGSLLGAMLLFAAPYAIPFSGIDLSNIIVGVIAGLASGLAGLFGMVLVIRFCQAFANYLQRDRLIESADRLMGLFKFFLLAYFGMLLLTPLAQMKLLVVNIVVVIVALVISLAFLLLCVRYILVVGRLGIAALRS